MRPTAVEFPLRGDWTAYHTPAEKVPSHGVTLFGQKYAYDFLKIDWEEPGFKFHRKSVFRLFTIGVSVTDCYGYGEAIYSPVDGEIVAVYDKFIDHRWVHPIKDFLAIYIRGVYWTLRKTKALENIIGNHIIIRMRNLNTYAFLVHLKNGSSKVQIGDKVNIGQHLACVGNTGNSTTPHLHFHLMDRAEILTAKGLPCAFKKYSVLNNRVWETKENEMPAKREHVRFIYNDPL